MATTQAQQFLHYDLGNCVKGSSVEVTLSSAANVQLMDAANFVAYRDGAPYRYYGGHVTKSPFLLRVPHDAQWHVAIDLGGAAGHVTASVRVL
ncbi:DUF1883 domain-containing protein [Blastopirellula sp. J2-11]|uniref:DUF1883 domain-containing protein n=1 Tax=Blastopirellula sp. J2-11 TaxID=2943192 RepID=UPI0021C9D4A8|nr:DUF1883 domain-containing protein [Blastopirellula sp. J2-11]UUO06153.1 DUF1883 domain-containing protein [Blastopirellula sp. J2-11]